MYRVIVAIAYLLLLLPQPARAAGAPGSFNVRLTDLPRGSSVFQDASGTPEEVYRGDTKSTTQDKQAGVLLLSSRLFTVPGTGELFSLLSFVYMFATTARAHAFYTSTRRGVTQAMARGDRLLPARGLGDEGFGLAGYLSTPTPGAYAVFRRGIYIAMIYAKHTTKDFLPAATMQIGRLVDARIVAG